MVSYQTNKTEFAKQYALNKENWDKAFEFMKNQDLENLAVGKYPINGEEVFASVTDIPKLCHIDPTANTLCFPVWLL